MIHLKSKCISLGRQRFFFVSALILFFIGGWSVLFAPYRTLVDESKIQGIEKISQMQRPFRSISLEYTIEVRKQSKEMWELQSENKLVWDRRAKRSYFLRKIPEKKGDSASGVHFVGNLTESFFCDRVLTSISSPTWTEGRERKSDSAIVSISKENERDSQIFDLHLLFYNQVTENYPLFMGNKIFFAKPSISLIKYDGKTVLCVEDSTKPGLNVEKFMFLFDVKTGLLIEKKEFGFSLKDGVLRKEVITKLEVREYLSSNGFFFPCELLYYSYPDGLVYRIKITKGTAKIDEIFDPKLFIPSIPPGSKVLDEINGKTYIAPSIGNSTAEKQIVKELDALFEKANK